MTKHCLEELLLVIFVVSSLKMNSHFTLVSFLFSFLFVLPLSAQQVKLEQPLLKDFPDQGFAKMTHGDYFTLEKDEFLYRLIDGLPHYYSQTQFEQLLQKLRPELKELYFFQVFPSK